MTQPASEQDWQAADALQGMQQGPAQTPPDLSAPPIYQGGAPVGALTETPRQATADTLNVIESQKDIEGAGGKLAQGEGSELGAKLDAAAQEKQQQAVDYQKSLADAATRHEEDRQRAIQAYQDYAKAAGQATNGKSARDLFWEKRSTGARVLSGFAAFASGLGTALLGQVGNPYLDHLNKVIAEEYDNHKQGIKDLFDKQVAAGKIADDEGAYQRFAQDAKLHYYDLASEHVKSELEAVKNRALGSNQRLLADKTITGLTQQQIAARQALAAQQAAAQAAGLAAARAKQKEAQAAYEDAYKTNLGAGFGNEQSRIEAAKFVEGKGYDRSIIAPIAEANGATYDGKTGKYVYPEVTPPASGEAGLVPAVDAVTGKPLKPEERRALEDQVVTDLNGTQRLARNKSEVPKITQQVQTIHGFNDSLGQLQELQNKWVKDGALSRADQSKWEALTGKLAVAYNGVAGSERATAEGEVENLKHQVMPEPPGILGTSIGGVKLTGAGAALQSKEARQAKLDALKDYVRSHSNDIEGKLHPAPGGAPAAAKPAAPYVPKSFKPGG